MKKPFFFLVFFISIYLYADQREFRFSARTSTGTFLSTTIKIYSYDSETNGYSTSTIGEGYTTPYSLFDI